MSNVTPLTDLTVSNLVIVAGKGGVGKTTVTAVLARAATDAGLRVLVVELDGKSTLAALVPDLIVRHISAADALEEYLFEHGFRRIAKRLAATGVIDVISTAAPGINDLVVLGKIKQLERSGEWDLVIVDGPAAGHAVTFLTSAAGLLDAIRGGPIRSQAEDVQAMLSDPERCQVLLVALPETTPINELIETAIAVETRVGARLGSIIVNQVDPQALLADPASVDFGRATVGVTEAVAAADFRRQRQVAQSDELSRLAESVPARQIHLDRVLTARLSPADVTALSKAIR